MVNIKQNKDIEKYLNKRIEFLITERQETIGILTDKKLDDNTRKSKSMFFYMTCGAIAELELLKEKCLE